VAQMTDYVVKFIQLALGGPLFGLVAARILVLFQKFNHRMHYEMKSKT
jgi:hypothetical protein